MVKMVGSDESLIFYKEKENTGPLNFCLYASIVGTGPSKLVWFGDPT
jgi:hypothetical protein